MWINQKTNGPRNCENSILISPENFYGFISVNCTNLTVYNLSGNTNWGIVMKGFDHVLIFDLKLLLSLQQLLEYPNMF